MTFENLGWNAHWQGAFAPFAGTLIPGRVRAAHRDLFLVWSPNGETEATPSGKLRLGDGWPVTGDWVALTPDGARVEAVLPRRTAFVRREPGESMRAQVIAANADVAFLVMGLDGDYNLRRLERYLYLTTVSGCRPVIVLNKSDLCETLAERCQECESWAPVVALSALNGDGLGALLRHVEPGETAVLLGSSGAGKTTLANRLRGFAAMRTQPVREHDSRGRHTTTHRELIPLDGLGWLLMDVPGLRELQLWNAPDALDQTFGDIAELAAQCRFRDCRHQEEPGCAVREALEQGRLPAGRLQNYGKFQKELAYLERTAESQLEEKRKWKAIHKEQKRLFRERGR
ncbi:MAG: ribosome small subunit-dependent GTPase A [Bryobacteraceae bacterium]|nr:ribosome small subunit-dependent GTPase A [Bryobacteraceae bacterium]